MTQPNPSVDEVAGAVQASVRLLVQRLRQVNAADGVLSSPETSALSRLDRIGPTSASQLAKLERISPQSMGVTVGALEKRGLVLRKSDPDDGRRSILFLTAAGRELLYQRRSERSELLSQALATHFSAAEVKALGRAALLIERLAESI